MIDLNFGGQKPAEMSDHELGVALRQIDAAERTTARVRNKLMAEQIKRGRAHQMQLAV